MGTARRSSAYAHVMTDAATSPCITTQTSKVFKTSEVFNLISFPFPPSCNYYCV